MLMPASVMTTLCGAFVHPRMSHWLPLGGIGEAVVGGRRPARTMISSGITMMVKNDAAGRAAAAGPAAAGDRDLWEKTTSGGGGSASQEDPAEEFAGAICLRKEKSPSPPLDILHRNEHFAAVCKPPLMHVHRPEFGSKDKEFVMQKARNQLGRRIYLPHRLDRGTSGCLLLGFSPEAGKVLHRALAHSTSRKTYVAIVRGSGDACVGKGWFTVDRPIKDDKKILREASTSFLFVRGGNAPDPRCCLVLAQPSSGRFHQIRRHLNGISHPVVGDSVHGSSSFNRELVAHPNNPAPTGRLLLHCLRLELPTLPGTGSTTWSTGTAAVDTQHEKDSRRSGGGSSEKGGKAQSGSDSDCFSDSDDGWTAPSEPDEGSLSGENVRPSVNSGPGLPRLYRVSPRADKATGEGGRSGRSGAEATSVEGLEVYAEPPDDMLAFLRGMSWWEEDMIQAAERSGRQLPR